jgi:hypothetical protein
LRAGLQAVVAEQPTQELPHLKPRPSAAGGGHRRTLAARAQRRGPAGATRREGSSATRTRPRALSRRVASEGTCPACSFRPLRPGAGRTSGLRTSTQIRGGNRPRSWVPARGSPDAV